MFKWLKRKPKPASELQCPAHGYYCPGRDVDDVIFCIDKPKLVEIEGQNV